MEWVAKTFVAVTVLTMNLVTMSVECARMVVGTGMKEHTVRTVRIMDSNAEPAIGFITLVSLNQTDIYNIGF